MLGGCFGSSGPSSVDPLTGRRYACRFPIISVSDMVRAQFRLLDHYGINCLHASVGASLGGQQALAVGALFPDRVSNIVSISASARSYPLSIALRYVQRQILMSDPHWNHGDYYDGPYPKRGMVVLRELATAGYRSGPEWNQRFGQRRDPQKPPSFQADFAIEKYMLHKGESFAHTYDPNSILYISKAMDLFDLGLRTPGSEESDLQAGLARIVAPVTVIGAKSDMLFPIWQQQEIASLLNSNRRVQATFYELDSMYGHDSFLIDISEIERILLKHL